jgi:hypothetical protein
MRPNPNATTLFSFPTARLAGLPAALCLALPFAFAAPASAQAVDSSLSFFITGRAIGQGGNLGGLSGADAHCQLLADSVGAGMKVWRAYLSTQAVGGSPAVNARDRIGTGPWFNANKVMVAANLTELHDTANVTTVTAAKGLTHRGTTVASNRHDVMTGTRYTGLAPAAGADSTCANWTSNASGLPARTIVGHHNRSGISSNMIPNSWNQAHVTSGCSQTNVEAGGGSGFFYCFALSTPTGLRSGAEQRIGESSGRAPYMLGDGPRRDEVVYRFELRSPARVEVTVHDLDGSRRAVLAKGLHRAGKHAVRWDGTSSSGLPMPAGLYVIVLKREAETGN